MCLKEAAERTYGDPKRASYDIKNEARKLTNLMDFGEYCRKNGLKGENVAEHVVFEGKNRNAPSDGVRRRERPRNENPNVRRIADRR